MKRYFQFSWGPYGSNGEAEGSDKQKCQWLNHSSRCREVTRTEENKIKRVQRPLGLRQWPGTQLWIRSEQIRVKKPFSPLSLYRRCSYGWACYTDEHSQATHSLPRTFHFYASLQNERDIENSNFSFCQKKPDSQDSAVHTYTPPGQTEGGVFCFVLFCF
jgi:hypothetical protein